MAACVNRAPEGVIGAAVAEVGVLDLLKVRYAHKCGHHMNSHRFRQFADFTIGRAWTSDYGDPHSPHDFDFIHPISPLHNVPTDRKLPPTILLTADRTFQISSYLTRKVSVDMGIVDDDRVVPLHSFKHAATLQHTLPHNPHPLLIRIDKKAGHGAGKSTDQRYVWIRSNPCT